MSTKKFGDVLAERRRRLGLTIDQAVSATKLRPQAIDAFERSDFSALPPKGYAQGMLSSYARFLRLDPKEVLSAYFDELYLYEREKQLAARSERSVRYDSPEDVLKRRTGGQYSSVRPNRYEDDTHVVYTQSNRRPTQDRSFGTSYSRYSSQSRNAGPVGQVRSGRAAQDMRYKAYRQGVDEASGAHDFQDEYLERETMRERYSSRAERSVSKSQPRASRYSKLEPAYESYDEYDRQASRGKSRSRKAVTAGSNPAVSAIATIADNFGIPRVYAYMGTAALTLVLLFILVFALKSCVSNSADKVSVEEKPVVALPAQSNVTPAASPQAATAAQDSTTQTSQTGEEAKKDILTISIAEGKSSYMDIELDGKIVAHQTFKGPLTESYTINSSIKVTATAANNVNLKLNGTKVKFKNSGSTGIYNYLVDENKERATTQDNNSRQQ